MTHECERAKCHPEAEKEPTPRTLTWLCIQPTGIEEFRGKVDVNVTEKEKDVATLPEAGSNVKSLSPGKFSIQLDEGEVPEVGSSKRKDGHGHRGLTLPRPMESPGTRMSMAHPHLATFPL